MLTTVYDDMPTSTNLKNNKPAPRICLLPNCLGLLRYLHLPFYPPTSPQNKHCLRRHLPKQHVQQTRRITSTHQPISQYNAKPMFLLCRRAPSERSHRTAPSIQRHIPPLQSTHQCPCPHNALHSRPKNNSPPAQFKPCHTNKTHHKRVKTKPHL